jgi:hypothetical protein
MEGLWRTRSRFRTKAEERTERQRFMQARRAESRYAQTLRQVATQIGHVVRGNFNPDDPQNPGWERIIDALEAHANLLYGWAGSVAHRMLVDVDRRDLNAWYQHGKEIGTALHKEVATTDLRNEYDRLLQQQIDAIADISRSSADRVKKLRDRAQNMVYTGERWEDLVSGNNWQDLVEGMNLLPDVAKRHANTIARTETARAQTTFTAIRAKAADSTTFLWRTVGDADVRKLHDDISKGKDKNGQSIGLGNGEYYWDDPPKLDDDRPGLPGTIYNCRCWAEPILPKQVDKIPKPRRSWEYEVSLRPEAEPINKEYRQGKITYGEYLDKLETLRVL